MVRLSKGDKSPKKPRKHYVFGASPFYYTKKSPQSEVKNLRQFTSDKKHGKEKYSTTCAKLCMLDEGAQDIIDMDYSGDYEEIGDVEEPGEFDFFEDTEIDIEDAGDIIDSEMTPDIDPE